MGVSDGWLGKGNEPPNAADDEGYFLGHHVGCGKHRGGWVGVVVRTGFDVQGGDAIRSE